MRRTVIIIPVLTVWALAGCGGGDAPEAAPTSSTPTPTVSPDAWARKMCEYLRGQEDNNEFANRTASSMATWSSIPELVDLGKQAQGTNSSNLLRGWCQRNVPSSGITPEGPPEGSG